MFPVVKNWKKSDKFGLDSCCIACRKMITKQRDSIRTDSARKIELHKIWIKNNPEKKKIYDRRFNDKNKDNLEFKAKNAARAAKWRKDNPEKIKESYRLWQKNNPDKVRANNHNRRTRMNQASGKLTKEAIELMYLVHGKACLKCGSFDRPTIDHVLPLNMGGTHYIYNLQPLCLPCNSGKAARHSTDYRSWYNV